MAQVKNSVANFDRNAVWYYVRQQVSMSANLTESEGPVSAEQEETTQF